MLRNINPRELLEARGRLIKRTGLLWKVENRKDCKGGKGEEKAMSTEKMPAKYKL